MSAYSLSPALLLLVACGGAHGTLVLDEATVSARLAEIGADVPGCDVTSGASAALRQLTEPGPLRIDGGSGPCGGTMSVSSEHVNGTTTYTVGFDQFCTSSADGNVTYQGTVVAVQEGKPTDNGPKISALEAHTDGPLVVAQNGQTIDITVDSVRTEYGVPDVWYPGAPDEANPDVTTVSHASAVFSSDGREEYVRDLVYTRAGVWDATYEVKGGQLGREGEDFVTIRTADGDPLVINVLGLQISSGTVEFGGADGTVLAVRPEGTTAGVMVMDLNDAPYAEGLNCAAGREPLVQFAMTLLTAVPIP